MRVPATARIALAVAVVAGAVLVLALVLSGGSGRPGGHASAPTETVPPLARVRQIRQTDELSSIFQTDRQLHTDPAGTLDLLRSLGVDTIRTLIPWGSLNGYPTLAPDAGSRTPPRPFDAANPAAYPASSWAAYDTIIEDARARGIRVDLTLSPPPPLWAQGQGDPGHPTHPQWRPDATAFGAFVKAVATRYSGRYTPPGAPSPLPRISMWAIWNEPNFGPTLAPQVLAGSTVPVSPSLYRPLVDAAWSALQRTGHAADTILIGELAPRGVDVGRGPGQFGYLVPLRFLRALYCVSDSLTPLTGRAATAVGCPPAGDPGDFLRAHPGLFHATGFAIHPYEFGPPDVRTPNEPDYADLANLSRFEQQLDAITSLYGSSRRYPIYNTEFGYETNPPETAFGTVTPALAAAYMNQAEYISWRDPRLQSYDQYLLQDVSTGEFATALEFYGGAPKPSYDAYRMPLWLPQARAAPHRDLELWGCVRAAAVARAQTGRPQSVQIQFSAAGRGTAGFAPLRTLTLTDPHGYFDIRIALPGAGMVRTAWTDPSGATIHSRVVTVSAAR